MAAKLARPPTALLLFHLSGHGGDAPVLGKLLDVGLPTAVFSQPFSGHGWMYFPALAKAGKKVVLLPTSDWSDWTASAGLLRVPRGCGRPASSPSAGRRAPPPPADPKQIKNRLGAEVIPLDNERGHRGHQGH